MMQNHNPTNKYYKNLYDFHMSDRNHSNKIVSKPEAMRGKKV